MGNTEQKAIQGCILPDVTNISMKQSASDRNHALRSEGWAALAEREHQ